MRPNKSSFLIISVISLILSCNTVHDNLPNVYVNITIDLNKPEFFGLNTPGNYVYITGGVAGIIVYYDLDGTYKAYERACPYDYNVNGARVYVTDIVKGIAADTVYCGSEFSITNGGMVVKGPAQVPLRQYKTYYYPNSNTLQITNY